MPTPEAAAATVKEGPKAEDGAKSCTSSPVATSPTSPSPERAKKGKGKRRKAEQASGEKLGSSVGGTAGATNQELGGKDSDARNHDAFLLVGDAVSIRPEVFDAYGNRAAAVDNHSGSLKVTLFAQGKPSEALITPPQLTQGVWVHDLGYELKHGGLHRVAVTINDAHVQGSPLEFLVKVRPPTFAPVAVPLREP
jgi:hypothetical protein